MIDAEALRLSEDGVSKLYDQLYTCAVCGARKVVPGLARSCEARHQECSERS